MDKFEENSPAALASKFVNHTRKHIFLTGKAGTGKTTFLKYIIKNTHKKAVIVAPTGIAAINAGGVTIHSLFQLPFGTFIPSNNNLSNPNLKITTPASLMSNLQMNSNKRKLLKEIELLIIDEVSMLRADLLDAIDTMLRSLKRDNRSFGGVQVLFIGDLYQLPPVVKDQEWEVLKNYYNSIFFFDAKALQNDKPLYIELEKIYRQSDDRFINVLNNLRNNEVEEEDVILLNEHYFPNFKPPENVNYITLTTHNSKADKLNKEYLNEIESKSYFFDASIKGDFNEFAYPVEKILELKKGSQVMFVKNDPSGTQKYFNGKLGIIDQINEDEIVVKCSDSNDKITLELYRWENVKYELNEITNEIDEKLMGTFTQYPIKLAWAITVHKSQGLTFSHAIVDIGNAFAPGQVYVALSRLSSMDGLVLTSHINYRSIRQDEKVMEFSKEKVSRNELMNLVIDEELEYVKEYINTCFDLNPLSKIIYYHIESYTKEETKSSKQQYKNFVLALRSKVNSIKENSDKFLIQVNNILNKNEGGYLELLNKRVGAATNYFAPAFKDISVLLIDLIDTVKKDKKVKTYLKELVELETTCNEQFKRMQKAIVFSEILLEQKEFTKDSLIKIFEDNTRLAQIQESLQVSKKKSKKGGKEKAVSKEEKVDTKEISFKLFSEGNSLLEIAKIRNMVPQTIEGHLAQYVAKGLLNSALFVSDNKKDEIIAAAKKADTFQLGAIKNELGDSFSYSEIRFAIAGYLSENVEYVKE